MKFLFDLDGTLFWSAEYIKNSYEYAHKKSGLEIPNFDKQISKLYSLSLKGYLKFLNVDKKVINEYCLVLGEIKLQTFNKFSHLIIPNYYLIDYLSEKKSYSYIVSNASFETANNYLNLFNIKFPSQKIFTREKLKATKPNKLAYQTITDLFSKNEEYEVYEDSIEGIKSAQEAGIKNIFKVDYDLNINRWNIMKYV